MWPTVISLYKENRFYLIGRFGGLNNNSAGICVSSKINRSSGQDWILEINCFVIDFKCNGMRPVKNSFFRFFSAFVRRIVLGAWSH